MTPEKSDMLVYKFAIKYPIKCYMWQNWNVLTTVQGEKTRQLMQNYANISTTLKHQIAWVWSGRNCNSKCVRHRGTIKLRRYSWVIFLWRYILPASWSRRCAGYLPRWHYDIWCCTEQTDRTEKYTLNEGELGQLISLLPTRLGRVLKRQSWAPMQCRPVWKVKFILETAKRAAMSHRDYGVIREEAPVELCHPHSQDKKSCAGERWSQVRPCILQRELDQRQILEVSQWRGT